MTDAIAAAACALRQLAAHENLQTLAKVCENARRGASAGGLAVPSNKKTQHTDAEWTAVFAASNSADTCRDRGAVVKDLENAIEQGLVRVGFGKRLAMLVGTIQDMAADQVVALHCVDGNNCILGFNYLQVMDSSAFYTTMHLLMQSPEICQDANARKRKAWPGTLDNKKPMASIAELFRLIGVRTEHSEPNSGPTGAPLTQKGGKDWLSRVAFLNYSHAEFLHNRPGLHGYFESQGGYLLCVFFATLALRLYLLGADFQNDCSWLFMYGGLLSQSHMYRSQKRQGQTPHQAQGNAGQPSTPKAVISRNSHRVQSATAGCSGSSSSAGKRDC